MYARILVPIDNSRHSDEALRIAARLGLRLASTVVGFHVYAARLHEDRFLQMESGLPDRYREPAELVRQRSVHESLIADGLRLISHSYLDHAQQICCEAGLPIERRLAEGKNYVETIREAEAGDYGLVVMGVLGLGARRRSLIGGVTERVLRRCPVDFLLVRKTPAEGNGLMVSLDGSANSFKALSVALALGKALGEPVEAVSVFDPHFHIAAFRSIAKVLSKEAGRVFRFDEQQKLHEEIIDAGLEKLYRGHLETAARLAEGANTPLKTTLLEGKPFQRVLDHAESEKPSLLLAGRFGLHRTELSDIGSTSENLARLARCSVLVVNGELVVEREAEAAPFLRESPIWTAAAEDRLQNVPPFARGMARQAIEDYAFQHGYAEITPEVMTKARAEFGV